MTLQKNCDECNKEIINKNNDKLGYSEWCLYHWQKRRDFCCNECLLRFILKKLIINKDEEKKDG